MKYEEVAVAGVNSSCGAQGTSLVKSGKTLSMYYKLLHLQCFKNFLFQ